MHTGSCQCGAVTFEVAAPLPPPDACHCADCRKFSGHYFVSTDVPRSALTVRGADRLTWFRSSDKVQRGFCATCGSSLFWDPIRHDWIGIAMGAFDGPTRTRTKIHVWVADKGDYYDITDGLPKTGSDWQAFRLPVPIRTTYNLAVVLALSLPNSAVAAASRLGDRCHGLVDGAKEHEAPSGVGASCR